MRTDEKLKLICDALQGNCGDLHAAARYAGLSPNFLFTWVKDDATAAEAVQEAQRVGWASLESEAIRRGVKGIEENVYYKGNVVDVKTVYSDGLLTKLLEARVPAFNKKEGAGSATFNGPTQINIMPRATNYDEWLLMKDTTLARRAQELLPAPLVKIAGGSVPDILQGEWVEVPECEEREERPLAALEGLL